MVQDKLTKAGAQGYTIIFAGVIYRFGQIMLGDAMRVDGRGCGGGMRSHVPPKVTLRDVGRLFPRDTFMLVK